jgi:hypothetical protein
MAVEYLLTREEFYAWIKETVFNAYGYEDRTGQMIDGEELVFGDVNSNLAVLDLNDENTLAALFNIYARFSTNATVLPKKKRERLVKKWKNKKFDLSEKRTVKRDW